MRNHSRSSLLAILSFTLFLPIAEAQTEFLVSVDTDQSQYFLGEQVGASVEACNPTSSTVLEFFTEPCDRDQFQVFDENGTTLVAYSDFGPWCLPFSVPLELGPGECQTIATWDWRQLAGGAPLPGDGAQVNPGIYTVIANYFNTTTEPAVFEILAVQQAPSIPTLGTLGMVFLALAVGIGGMILVRCRS